MTAYEILDEAQKEVIANEYAFPVWMDWNQGQAYRQGLIAAYQHALEMIGE